MWRLWRPVKLEGEPGPEFEVDEVRGCGILDPFKGSLVSRIHGGQSGGEVEEHEAEMDAADGGEVFVDEAKEVGLSRDRGGKFLGEFPKESIPEKGSPGGAGRIRGRGVDGVDVAADAEGADTVQSGFSAAASVAGPASGGFPDQTVGNPLLVGGIGLGNGPGKPDGGRVGQGGEEDRFGK